jgi:hypothetical protein
LPYTPFITFPVFINFLAEMGILPNLTDAQTIVLRSNANLSRVIGGACQEWERRTGYTPFVVGQDANGNNVQTTRIFNGMENGMLDLRGGMVGVPSALAYLSYDGVTTTPITTFHPAMCYPQDAPAEQKPYTYFKFYDYSTLAVGFGGWDTGFTNTLPVFTSGVSGSSLSVTGLWGYCTLDNLPFDVVTAVLSQAMQEPMIAGELARTLLRGGLVRVQSEAATLQYQPDNFLKIFASLATRFDKTLQSYRRVRF